MQNARDDSRLAPVRAKQYHYIDTYTTQMLTKVHLFGEYLVLPFKIVFVIKFANLSHDE